MVILEKVNFPIPTVPPLKHTGAVAVLKRITQAHIAVQEEGGVEATTFDSGGGKGGNLKGI